MKIQTGAIILAGFLLLACTGENKENNKGFPYHLPDGKPERELSAAVERLYEAYPAPRPESNELFSQFKYTELKGFDYNGHDGTRSRRDPSKILYDNGKYYVWYTHRKTEAPPSGAAKATDTIPSADWDLADIWYATSQDGFIWQEQGVAVSRPPKPDYGWRSVTTADILAFRGKYYLYYQGFNNIPLSGGGDIAAVTVAEADSPRGPWRQLGRVVVDFGRADEWDAGAIHDPLPIVYRGKIYLYYKGQPIHSPDQSSGIELVRAQGVAIADHPLGPFKKHPLNPVVSSGHETTLFPFKGGVAALVIRDGNEHNTIQYAEDWVNFEIKSIVELMPNAGGPFVPDAFTDVELHRRVVIDSDGAIARKVDVKSGGGVILDGRLHRGRIGSAGELGQFLLYAIILGVSTAGLSEIWGELQRAAGATERLFELLDAEPEIKAPAQPMPLPAQTRGEVRFAAVSFAYPSQPDRLILENLELTVQPGESVALVSDAGTPLISDPGFRLIAAVQAAGLPWDSRDAHSAIYDAEMTAALGGVQRLYLPHAEMEGGGVTRFGANGCAARRERGDVAGRVILDPLQHIDQVRVGIDAL